MKDIFHSSSRFDRRLLTNFSDSMESLYRRAIKQAGAGGYLWITKTAYMPGTDNLIKGHKALFCADEIDDLSHFWGIYDQIREGSGPLNALRDTLENGPMNCTAYQIWKYLIDGQDNFARFMYHHDGDKVSGDQKKAIESILGPRAECVRENIKL